MRLPLTNVRWWAAISLLILSLNAISDTNDMQMVGDTVVFRHDRDGQEYTITVMNPVVWQGDKAVFMACHKKVAYALLSRAHSLILRAVNQVNSDNILGLEYVVTEINPNDDKVDLSYWTSIGLRRQGQLPINELDKGRLYTQICVSTASVSEVIASLSSDEDWQAPVVEKKPVEDKKPVDPEVKRLQAESEARLQAIVDAQFDAFKLGEVYKADLKCANNIKCKRSMRINLSSPNEILRSGLKENYAIYSQEIESFVTSQSYRSMRLLTEYSFGYSPKEWKALLEKGMWVPLSLTLDENRQIHSYKIMKSYPSVLPEQVVSALNDLYKLKEGMINRNFAYDFVGDDVTLSFYVKSDDNKIVVTIFAEDKRPVQAIHNRYVAEAEKAYSAFLKEKLAEIEKTRNKSFSL